MIGTELRSSWSKSEVFLSPVGAGTVHLPVGHQSVGTDISRKTGSLDWYGLARVELQTMRSAVRSGNPPNMDMLKWIAEGIVGELQHSDNLIVRMFASQRSQAFLTNPIHVAILSAKLGLGLGWKPVHVERLALAGLVHDIGMPLLPEALLLRAGSMSKAERKTFQRHPLIGAEIMKSAGSEYEWLVEVVLQAHERRDGNGYPNQLRGSDIHPYAYVIRLADTVDELSGVRRYRSRVSLHATLMEILRNERKWFPRKLVKTLIEACTLYPIGTWVRLRSGVVGRVIAVNPGLPLRPVVMTVESHKEGPTQLRILDLRTEVWTHVQRALR